ncbi:hypothetical protein NEAUS03_0558 [Nematocida ausubeli]|nr:hypothetical protein NEAUS03_0558 [Nematocida ausubeli]
MEIILKIQTVLLWPLDGNISTGNGLFHCILHGIQMIKVLTNEIEEISSNLVGNSCCKTNPIKNGLICALGICKFQLYFNCTPLDFQYRDSFNINILKIH